MNIIMILARLRQWLFSTISYLITGSRIYHKELRSILVGNVLSKLSANCNTFFTENIFIHKVSNIQEWVIKRE